MDDAWTFLPVLNEAKISRTQARPSCVGGIIFSQELSRTPLKHEPNSAVNHDVSVVFMC